MAKYSHKRLANQSNLRAITHRHVKAKPPKKLPKPAAGKTKATKVSAIMDQLGGLDGNGRNTNINHLSPLF